MLILRKTEAKSYKIFNSSTLNILSRKYSFACNLPILPNQGEICRQHWYLYFMFLRISEGT